MSFLPKIPATKKPQTKIQSSPTLKSYSFFEFCRNIHCGDKGVVILISFFEKRKYSKQAGPTNFSRGEKPNRHIKTVTKIPKTVGTFLK
jgi:hypothetical protein